MKKKFYFPHLHKGETNIEGSPVFLTIDSSSNYEAPGDCLGYFTLGPTMNMDLTIWDEYTPIKKMKVNARIAPMDVYDQIWNRAYEIYENDDDYRKEVNEEIMLKYPEELKNYSADDNIYEKLEYGDISNDFDSIFNSYMTEEESYQERNDGYAESDCDSSVLFTTAFAKFIEDCINGSDDYKVSYCYSDNELYGRQYAGDIISIKKAV